jgi:MFS family permease
LKVHIPPRRRRAFWAVIAAHFFSALADNALLIAAIGLLLERHAAAWTIPALRVFFYASYIFLAVFVGAIADALPKGRVILATNLFKLAGCGLLLAQVHPLLAYALVGLGAAAYSPAKYGILPELLSPAELVAANAWMEISTVIAIILGVALGSLLMDPGVHMAQWASTPALNATWLLGLVYLAAVLCAVFIPSSPASNASAIRHPQRLFGEFNKATTTLWRDHDSQISLAVTSLFWAAAAVLQFLVLRWAESVLQLALSQAALLQAAVAFGMVVGAMGAARWIPMRSVLKVLPLGLSMGILLPLMLLVTQVWTAVVLLAAIGVMAGLLLVPMNALLQQRGQLLMHPGQSIAVQNFHETLASLVLLAVYGLLIQAGVSLAHCIVGFGLFVSIAVGLVLLKQRRSGAVGYSYP